MSIETDKVNCGDKISSLAEAIGFLGISSKQVHVEPVDNGFVVTCGFTKSIARTPKQVATLVRKALTVDVTP